MSILRLTLKKKWFDLMITGEKTKEYRELSDWIQSRLLIEKTSKLKVYDRIRFTNGYGSDKPWFECEFKGAGVAQLKETIFYNDGSKLELNGVYWVIRLGKVLDKGNIKIEGL